MVIVISCDLSTVTGDSYMMAQQDLSCVINPPVRRVKRERGVKGIGIGMWLATIGACLGTGGFGCVALSGASLIYIPPLMPTMPFSFIKVKYLSGVLMGSITAICLEPQRVI